MITLNYPIILSHRRSTSFFKNLLPFPLLDTLFAAWFFTTYKYDKGQRYNPLKTHERRTEHRNLDSPRPSPLKTFRVTPLLIKEVFCHILWIHFNNVSFTFFVWTETFFRLTSISVVRLAILPHRDRKRSPSNAEITAPLFYFIQSLIFFAEWLDYRYAYAYIQFFSFRRRDCCFLKSIPRGVDGKQYIRF